MSEIVLRNICKSYENGFQAVKDFNLEVGDGELVVFVGPSGCGKSTTLRMIAGLESITDGELWIGERLVNYLPPKERDLSMVFQSYAMYPQMTVYDNIAFSLQVRHVPKKEIDRRVKEVAELLGLSQLLKRRPKDLSGGQRQRVAIGNAIIREPKVLLMDEPLSNLDAKLRTQMRVELANIHKQLGNTIIYVTHDQTEAMTLGDRIVVMNQGVIQQADTPQQLYDYPVNRFVAGFIGSPAMNFFKGIVLERHGEASLCMKEQYLRLPEYMWKILRKKGYYGREVELGIRPEQFLEEPGPGDEKKEWRMQVMITARELLGAENILHFQAEGQDCCARVSGNSAIKKGDVANLWMDLGCACVFDAETGENILLSQGGLHQENETA
ncbi:MAG: sn-glycerol-3-phosphate ABC transporter ATP-binding protein UgpC [Eubacteriales bacterium]|nr:sn-glycerol-3-phosphate ABC transporter ATP-binding protein UgpC [Eubacteriales bacterium]